MPTTLGVEHTTPPLICLSPQNFSLGKEAYSCGEYMASVKLLEVAVEVGDVGRQEEVLPWCGCLG